jgi:hypothetical protein
MRFQQSQPAGTAILAPSSASTGPLKIWMHHPPNEKRTPTEITKKNWQHFELLRTAMARTGRYEEEALHKAGFGANRPRVQRRIIRS